MRIVDAHSHLGTCRVFDADQPADQLLATIDREGIDASIVQPFPGAPDPAGVHDEIARLAADRPGRVFGLASLTPHQAPDAYRAEVRRCVEELGFVGVKCHAIGHAVNPRSRDARLIFETAAELGIPVMVHTGHGVPFADPAMWIPLAQAFPSTTVVLAHAGAPGHTGAAVVAAQVCPNIVLETSWTAVHDLRRAIAAIGAERVMYGSDLTPNAGLELAKYRSLGLTDGELAACLGGNAERVFGLSAHLGSAQAGEVAPEAMIRD